jgi:hypothetical protein
MCKNGVTIRFFVRVQGGKGARCRGQRGQKLIYNLVVSTMTVSLRQRWSHFLDPHKVCVHDVRIFMFDVTYHFILIQPHVGDWYMGLMDLDYQNPNALFPHHRALPWLTAFNYRPATGYSRYRPNVDVLHELHTGHVRHYFKRFSPEIFRNIRVQSPSHTVYQYFDSNDNVGILSKMRAWWTADCISLSDDNYVLKPLHSISPHPYMLEFNVSASTVIIQRGRKRYNWNIRQHNAAHDPMYLEYVGHFGAAHWRERVSPKYVSVAERECALRCLDMRTSAELHEFVTETMPMNDFARILLVVDFSHDSIELIYTTTMAELQKILDVYVYPAIVTLIAQYLL